MNGRSESSPSTTDASTSDSNAAYPRSSGEPDAAGAVRSTPCKPSEETCDQIDNDCDARIDEQVTCASKTAATECVPKLWFRDCDGDGFAASSSGSASSCMQPAPPSDCRGWTDREPLNGSIDCDDNSTAYAPGADFGVGGFGAGDRNCDGVIERRVQRVAEPRVVERKPRPDASFCRFDLDAAANCECFLWDPTQWEGQTQPPCALNPLDTISSPYKAWFGTDEYRSCEAAVTVATASVDEYVLLQTCR